MTKDLTKGNIFKTLILFSIPLLFSNVISQTYNLIDIIIAGRILGDNALAATGSTTTFIQFLSSIFWGLGVALAALSGEFYGKKEYKNIQSLIKTSLIFTTSIMLILCLLCLIFSRTILILLKVDNIIFDDALIYFRIYMVALFFQAINYAICNILSGLGNSRFPTLLTLISGTLNLGLNLLFVMVFNMNVDGLALATLISCFISTFVGIIKSFSLVKELGGKNDFHFSKSKLNALLKLAIPCILQQCSLYLSSVIIQPFVNDLGYVYSAGYSIAMNAYLFFTAIFHTISRTIGSYSSQSLGANKEENYSKGIKVGILLQVILLTPLMIITIVFPNNIFSLFLKNNDSSVLKYSVSFAYYCIPFLYICAYGNLMHSFFKSIKAANVVLITTTIFTISRITFTYLLPAKDDLFSVYIGLTISWAIEAIFLTISYYFVIIRKKNTYSN